MAILHIYRARANSLLFCYHQETESESCEIKVIIPQPISTHKKISKDIWDNGIILQVWSKIL